MYRSVHDGPIASVRETRTGRGGYDIRPVRVSYRSEVFGLPQFVTIFPDGTVPISAALDFKSMAAGILCGESTFGFYYVYKENCDK